jgi:hypothetical protein
MKMHGPGNIKSIFGCKKMTFIDSMRGSWLGMNNHVPSNYAACKHYTTNSTSGV